MDADCHVDAPGFRRLRLRSIGWILLFGVVLNVVWFGPGWALTYHEVFFAQPSREMLKTGDWLVPRLLGQPCWQKPPGMSWLIAASMAVFQTEAEWAVRLPSRLANLITALAIATIAARWYGDRIGRLTGLIQLSTFATLFQSRLAEADMPLAASVTVAMAAFAVGVLDRSPRARLGPWPVVFFAAAVVAFLLKGPLGLAFIGLPCGVFALWERRRRPWRFLLDPIGWILLITGTLAWPIAASRREPSLLDALWLHNVARFTGELGGRSEGPWYYLVIVPLILLPWTPFAAGRLWRWATGPFGPQTDRQACRRFLACWTLVGIAIISGSAWKHKHYAIPAMPPLAILAAVELERFSTDPRRCRLLSMIACIAAIGGVVGLGVGVGVGSERLSDGRDLAGRLGAVLVVGGLGMAIADRWRRRGDGRAVLAGTFVTVAVTVVMVESLVLPKFDRYRPVRDLAYRLNATVPPGASIELADLDDPQILYYLRFPMTCAPSLDHCLQAGSTGNPRYLVTPRRNLAALRDFGTVEVIEPGVPPRGLMAARVVLADDAMTRMADSQANSRVLRAH